MYPVHCVMHGQANHMQNLDWWMKFEDMFTVFNIQHSIIIQRDIL